MREKSLGNIIEVFFLYFACDFVEGSKVKPKLPFRGLFKFRILVINQSISLTLSSWILFIIFHCIAMRNFKLKK